MDEDEGGWQDDDESEEEERQREEAKQDARFLKIMGAGQSASTEAEAPKIGTGRVALVGMLAVLRWGIGALQSLSLIA